MNRIKWKWNIILAAGFLLLTVIYIYRMCSNSNQAMSAVGLSIQFEGQFSYDEKEWYSLGQEQISGDAQSVVLKGKFVTDVEVEDVVPMNMYVSHVIIDISQDDTQLFRFHPTYEGYGPEMCGNTWVVWNTDALEQDKELTIRLTNCHVYGNDSAYEELLKSFYIAPYEIIEEKILNDYELHKDIGVLVTVIGIAFGIVLMTCMILRVKTQCELWIITGIAIAMGAYVMCDTPAVNIWSELVVLSTHLHLMSLMLVALFIIMGLFVQLEGVVKKAANIGIILYGAYDVLLFTWAVEKERLLWDMLPYWAFVTVILLLVMFFLSLHAYVKKQKQIDTFFVMFGILALALSIELINGYFELWKFGTVFKIVYLMIFVVQTISVVAYIIKNHGAYAKTKILEHELEHSRVVLSLGQIKSHFIFNILNAVSGMYKTDPERADETILLFSRFLRNNMDVLEDSDLVSFDEVLGHLRDYIQLEQIRFGERISYKEEIEFSNFMMPQMILQPLVENAIKHGLLLKPEGGTVTVKTYKEKGKAIIKIQDDGVGFDHTKEFQEESLGIRNVKFRLENMVNGSLWIESEVGKGTVMTITIPHKER